MKTYFVLNGRINGDERATTDQKDGWYWVADHLPKGIGPLPTRQEALRRATAFAPIIVRPS